mmetsp:Transcript_18365/g.42844  ORF Transcript_18365/g.42844 Transcript_18365/m.42844 type:complete len:107 (-) Transcript_18365:1338-1658(-)
MLGMKSIKRGKNPAIAADIASTILVPCDRRSTEKTEVANSGAFVIQKVETMGNKNDTKIHTTGTPPITPAAIMGTAKTVQSAPPKALVQYQPLMSAVKAANGVIKT